MPFYGYTGINRVDPSLSISDQIIPNMGNDNFSFLGMPVRASNNMNEGRESLKADLDSMLTRVDSSLVTPQ